MAKLSQEHRRAICFQEAGRAVIHALGGARVYRVAIAPTGSSAWCYQPRKGGEVVDRLGICEASDVPTVTMNIHWDEGARRYVGDRDGFEWYVNLTRGVALKGQLPASPRDHQEEWHRLVRAHLCSRLAGPVAANVYAERAFEMQAAMADAAFEHDLAVADGLAQLLPPGALEHLVRVTVETLRTPSVWGRVTALAEELECVGDMADQLDDYLPKPLKGWPPGAAAVTEDAPALGQGR
ncbi:hypothetical protein [Burkholderia pseudomallei]|uniref:hypothetical protein n=1 Tax=Burkholderia pseudomallei TaxID=28450 RepID=UPI000F0687BC|nr:hypothetical protein [Burkholderia pseudomallei]MBF3496276.1 hypothetical protein [Burkholderia pseudomallei]NVH69053.1 hypothetical protein [Burkholderia pseudomallei]VBH17701.1 Uncharacterised protein [Burkholderia pseudomallei]